jgi:hypothetical protein
MKTFRMFKDAKNKVAANTNPKIKTQQGGFVFYA